MKIGDTPSLRLLTPAEGTVAPRRAVEPPRATRSEPTEARFTEAGAFVGSLREEAAEYGVIGDVRPDFVEAMRAEIRAGRLGSPQDIERALDALMGEL